MSEVRDAERVTTLEELFLSRDFGKPLARPAPLHDDTLFGGAPPRVPLVPLVVPPSVGHSSTSHLRQQKRVRVFAAVSGVAAAVLVAIGVVGAIVGKPGTTKPTFATPPTTTPKGGPTGSGPTGGGATGASGGGPSGATTGSGGSGIELASVVGPSGVKTNPGATKITITTPGGKPVTVTVTPTPPTSSSGGLLSPVVVLVGHLVITVGATATVAGTGLSGTLPVLTPVTSGVIGSLGTGLSGLGASLVRLA